MVVVGASGAVGRGAAMLITDNQAPIQQSVPAKRKRTSKIPDSEEQFFFMVGSLQIQISPLAAEQSIHKCTAPNPARAYAEDGEGINCDRLKR